MTDLQRRIAALSPEKRAVLESRIAGLVRDRGPVLDGGPITARDRTRPTPLSFAQQAEWAAGRLRTANNVSGALSLDGEVDVALLSRVFTTIVRRHEVLRSTIDMHDDAPVQTVHPATEVPIPVVDLTDLTPARQREEVRQRYDDELVLPFDASTPLKLRITLLRLAADRHVALFTTHHAASDAWSLAILVRETVALYSGYRAGREDELPPVAIQFGDFASWQREQLGQERMAAHLEYWRSALAGIPPRMALPTDRPRPARPTYAAAQHQAALTPDLTADVQRFADREEVSLFMVLLAACAVLVHRYTDQSDLVIGSALSGRNRLETEQLIGCFTNLIPLRVRVTGRQSLRDIVRQTRDATSAGFEHQDLPFDRLVEEFAPRRDPTQAPLIQMMLNVLTMPANTLQLPGLRITPEPINFGPVSVDLTLNAVPRGDRIDLWWHFSTELFDTDTVVRLADQFRHVLLQLVQSPDIQVSRVELVDASSRDVRTPAAQSTGDAVGFLESFRRRVSTAPHAPAIVHDGVATSYAELNRDANRLAHRLRAVGVGRETPVGILLDRSPRLAVAILGVLKAGGVYIPLDPEFPIDRIAFILRDAGAAIVLSEQQLSGLLGQLDTPAELMLVDEPDADQAEGADDDPAGAEDLASLAYVVYTSGSTGQPKGVMIERGSLAVFARDVADRLGLGSGDRFLQFASPSFDVLAEELFPTWVAGGGVVIPTQRLLGGDDDLADLIERNRLTVMELPTAYWHEWVRSLDRDGRQLPSWLRLVIVGGERVLPERLAIWRRLNVALTHVYGVTETTVSSTFFRLDPNDPVDEWPNLPIGTALPSADLRILDAGLRPVPAGGVGELYISGISLARGYLARPDLTAQRFIADPDPVVAGQRLYRTGDLVRQRTDGNLEFLSRVDTQVKIRGFRIEPAEIESALCRHPQIDESVVVAYEPAPGDRRLLAYVVPRAGAAPNASELRRFLERELPPFMVPSAFIPIDALPLSSNGKVDHARLPEPGDDRAPLAEEYVAPQSPLQQRLADIMAAVIGLAQVGAHDNFFELGGDSILAIQFVARAQAEGITLTPLDLFASPTVAELAELAEATGSPSAGQNDPAHGTPLTPQQRRFCTTTTTNPHHWTTSTLLELHTAYQPPELREAVDRLLDHHDSLRQRFQLDGGRTRVTIAPPGDETPFEVFDLSDLDDSEQTRTLYTLTGKMQTTLDLTSGPVIRVALFRLRARRGNRLAIVAHRLTVDDVSMRILCEDLQTACAQLVAGKQVALPRSVSWQSWVRRLAAHAGSPSVRSQREYWSQVVMAPAGRLPVDTTEDADADTAATDSAATVQTVVASLDRERTNELLHSIPDSLSCRVEDVLLAALARILTSWTGAHRHTIDLVSRGRAQILDGVDLARTVGWLEVVHPLALKCESDSSPAATLRTTKETLRDVPSGGVGWQLLRQDPDHVPDTPAQIAFSYVEPSDQFRPTSGDFIPASEPLSSGAGRIDQRTYPIEIHFRVVDDQLVAQWRYHENLHTRQTLTELAGKLLQEIHAMIELSRTEEAPGRTPSDFPLARIDQAELDTLLSRLASGQEPR